MLDRLFPALVLLLEVHLQDHPLEALPVHPPEELDHPLEEQVHPLEALPVHPPEALPVHPPEELDLPPLTSPCLNCLLQPTSQVQRPQLQAHPQEELQEEELQQEELSTLL
jgi:hypothetical protein